MKLKTDLSFSLYAHKASEGMRTAYTKNKQRLNYFFFKLAFMYNSIAPIIDGAVG